MKKFKPSPSQVDEVTRMFKNQWSQKIREAEGHEGSPYPTDPNYYTFPVHYPRRNPRPDQDPVTLTNYEYILVPRSADGPERWQYRRAN